MRNKIIIALIVTGIFLIITGLIVDNIDLRNKNTKLTDKNSELSTLLENSNIERLRLEYINNDLWELYYSQVTDYNGEYEYYE